MRRPPKKEITKLFNAWFNVETNFPMPEEAFTAGYELCWKQFEEFVKSEIGEEHEPTE